MTRACTRRCWPRSGRWPCTSCACSMPPAWARLMMTERSCPRGARKSRSSTVASCRSLAAFTRNAERRLSRASASRSTNNPKRSSRLSPQVLAAFELLARWVDHQRHTIEPVLQDGVDAAVRDAAGHERAFARGTDPFVAIASDQTHQTEARTIAVLRVRPRAQDPLDQLADRWANAGAPGDQLQRRPLQMGTMRRRHVLADGGEPTLAVLTQVAGDASATVEDLDHPSGGAHLDRLTHRWSRTE